ncbi:hypothetical protein [Campylobacter sp. VTCC 70190]|uniref:hypothetical protein n=1 Tax=Campylobacter sp. VTCC 70190 TaxID=3392118 RepID=UPI00398EFCB1
MLISEFLERLKRRLKDEGVYHKYSNEELLASLNQEQNIIISEFEMNVNHYTKEVSPEDNILHLDKIALKIILAKLNKKLIELKNYKKHLENENIDAHLMSFSNMQSVALMPKEKANGLLEVWANVCVFHKSENEKLFLNDLLVNALLYGVFKNVLQSENSELTLQKISFYEKLYNNEISRLRAIVSNTREKEILFSKVSRI